MGSNGDDRTSFWQFSDQLRSQTAGLSNLSIGGGDSIWNDSFLANKRLEERRNFDQSQQTQRGNTAAGSAGGLLQEFNNNGKIVDADFGGGSFGWKGVIGTKNSFHTNNNNNSNSNSNGGAAFGGAGVIKNGFFSKEIRKNRNFNDDFSGKGNAAASAKKKKNTTNSINNNGGGGSNDKNAVDKRFKTLPASEALPRNEAIGGYIFVCNNDTMPENLRRELFGLPPRYRDSVRAITPGLPLFLYNYSDHLLHGIFQAASFGGSNIDPTAWEDKKIAGESRFPAQVRVKTKKLCVALEEDSFRPILHHYDGPKFRLELSVPEALALLDKFEEKNNYA